MSSCPSCCGDNAAEIVPVTISNTNLYIDDLPAVWRTDAFGYADALDHKTFLLTYYPYEGRSVLVSRNSGVQRFGIDFTVSNGYVVLTVPLVDTNDNIFVNYWHVDGVSQATGSVGSIVASAGTSLTGYLRMDGTSALLWTNYTALYDWFYDATYGAARRTALLESDDGTTFVLNEMKDVSYSGGELVTLNKFISLGGS